MTREQIEQAFLPVYMVAEARSNGYGYKAVVRYPNDRRANVNGHTHIVSRTLKTRDDAIIAAERFISANQANREKQKIAMLKRHGFDL